MKQTEKSSNLSISFPKSSEDHRLRLIGINDALFAIIFAPLESLGPINLDCGEWSLVLLAPVKSKTNISISATNIICLNEVSSEEGSVSLYASNRLVRFPDLLKPLEKVSEVGERGKFHFGDDPGALLYFFKLFEGIVSNIHDGSPEMCSQAQQQVIRGLCTLADRIKGTSDPLVLLDVLSLWNIPYSKTSNSAETFT